MKSESYEFLKGSENGHVAIGFGSYGMVKLARNTDTKQLVAIKMIYSKNAKDEIAMHKKLEHPNIIRLLNYYFEKDRNVTYMVLEYADGGSLFDKIKASIMPKAFVRRVFQQACGAIMTLHKNGVMHRDIKPENILLTKKGDAKLCDFGFAAILGERKTLCGTYQYMAPEMIQNMTYDHKIDVWALGILLFEMIEGVAPFRGESPEEVLAQMKKSIFFSNKFESKEIQLIKFILRVSPNNRPEVSAILDSPYFQQDLLPQPPLKPIHSAPEPSTDVDSSMKKDYPSSPTSSFIDSKFHSYKTRQRQPTSPLLSSSTSPLLKYEHLPTSKLHKPVKPTTPTLQQLIGKQSTGDLFPKEPVAGNRSVCNTSGNGSFQSPWRNRN